MNYRVKCDELFHYFYTYQAAKSFATASTLPRLSIEVCYGGHWERI